MPQRISSPGIAEFRMTFHYDNQVCQNVYHYKQNELVPWTVGELQGMCEFLRDWWVTEIGGMVPHSLILMNVQGTDLTSPTGAQVTVSDELPAEGQATASQLPNNVTVAVRWGTATRGRSAHGRTYHLGLLETFVIGNVVQPSAIDGLTAHYSKLIDDPGIIELTQFCVLSERTNGALRAEGVGFEIISCTIDNIVDSQRRRLPGRGS